MDIQKDAIKSLAKVVIILKIRSEFTCPLELVHDMIKGKWKLIIIFNLRNGSCSFSELLHSIKGISQKMLLEQLNELKQFGLIEKKSYSGYPLKVDYFLTAMGLKMLTAIEIMQGIGIEYMVQHGMSGILDEKGICY